MADLNKTILFEYDVKTGKFIDENNKVFKSLKALVDETKKATEASQQMGDVIGKNSEVVFGSISHIKNQIGALKQQRDSTVIGSTEFDNLTNRIENLQGELKKATTATLAQSEAQEKTGKTTKELAKLQQNQARSAGLAGAAAFELGRTISDLPFGLVAISNNISQLGTLFAALVANAGSVTKAMKLLKAQLMGPAGILIAFQAVTAAVTIFAQRQNKAKDAVQGFDAALKNQGKTYDELSDILNNVNENEERRLSVLRALGQFNSEIAKIANDENLTVQERIELGNRLNQARIREREIQKAATDELVKRNKLYANLTVSEEELQNRIERRAKTAATLERGYVEVMQNGVLVQKQLNLEQRQQIETTLNGLDREINAIKEGIPIREAIIAQLESLSGQQETINDITEEYNSLTKSREEGTKKAIKAEEDRIKIQRDALIRLQDQTDKFIRDEEASQIAQLNRSFEREIEAAEKAGADTTDIEAFYANERLRVKQEFAEKRAENERNTNLKIEDAQRSHNIKMAQLEARLAGDRIKQSDRTESEILDAEISILESRIKVLRILAQTSDVSRQSLDEALIVLDDLIEKRSRSGDDIKRVLGINEEDLKAGIEATQKALSTLGDVFSAQAEREIAIETNRTNALNDQLKQRLANEQLSADERDKINQEISRNEAELVRKENEINKKRFQQEKAVNIALATVNTFSAATGVLAETKGGSFARIAGMIAVIGAGLAQVAMIAKQEFTSKALPSPNLTGVGGSSASSAPAFNVVGASGQNQIAQAIATIQDIPFKTFVVSSDVTTAQELERKIIQGASI